MVHIRRAGGGELEVVGAVFVVLDSVNSELAKRLAEKSDSKLPK